MKTIKTILAFIALMRAMWIVASSLAATDAATKSLAAEANIAEMAASVAKISGILRTINNIPPMFHTTASNFTDVDSAINATVDKVNNVISAAWF